MTDSKRNPDIVYHYTSVETLYKILDSVDENGNITLHLNSIRNMNDKFEGLAGLDVALRYFEEHEQKREEHENFYKSLQAIEKLEKKDDDIHSLSDDDSSQYPLFDTIFSMSFSQKHDDLSQWRAYGDNAKGVAIGLDFQILKDTCKEYKNIRFDKVEYVVPNTSSDTIKTLLDKIKDEKVDVQESFNWDPYVSGALCFFKDNAFCDEEEYRFMCNTQMMPPKMPPKSLEQKFKCYLGQIIPYLELKVPKIILKQIILGADGACIQKERFLEKYLVTKEFMGDKDTLKKEKNTLVERGQFISVERSKIPYIPK